MTLSRSGHVDTFSRDNLPSEDLWPKLEFTLPELQYPERLNAAAELLDGGCERFGTEGVAVRVPPNEPWNAPEGGGETWTYGGLQARVSQVAHLLVSDFGLRPGNRVMLRIPNNVWAVICWLAVVKAGGVAVTSMVAWRSSEIQKIVDRVEPALLIVDYRFVEAVPVDLPMPVIELGGENDAVKCESLMKPTHFRAVDTSAEDVAVLAPTSGTTGEPKIAAHFHRDFLAIADTFARSVLGIRASDVVAGSPPLAFTFGLGGLVVFPLRFGASSYLMEKPGPRELSGAIETAGITVLFTAPTGYRAILRDGGAQALGRLRVAVSAGEHLSAETATAVHAASGIRLIDGIGSTELLHVFISAPADEVVPGSTGKVVPGYRAVILDDLGEELPAGEPGRLAVIGPTGCRYLGDERQLQYVQDGWNITGDVFTRDEDGYFFYQGRVDDMIVASGYNIGAPEVEAVIDSHRDVVESAVVARPDPEKGAIVNAFVVLAADVSPTDSTRESIRDLVAQRLAPYKIPRRIDFIESLPRNPSGKLLRFPLRERAAGEAAAAMNAAV